MPNQIPQELLDQMIHMNNEQFDHIEKRWRDNLTVKQEYERQYYTQLKGYLDYNSAFKENQRPLKPHERAAILDQELLKEAQEINIENARHQAAHEEALKTQQQRQELVKSFISEKEKILTAEKAPEQPDQLRLENPAAPHISEKAKEITAKLFAAMKYEALEREWETQLNYPANDLYPADHDIELER
ncbi:hypothetical protein ACTJJB_22580 [Chitinophaga sp. 22536]|uniref:hypothetical protein n=1 Tax=unclassified Chitinophaga TaxID=2619133 RepID=UPI003F83A6EF